MKINMERFKLAEKPLAKSSKRFKELPGGVLRREQERYGGPEAESRRGGFSHIHQE